MRFKLKPVSQPEKFAKRIRKKFAFFPKTLKDQYFVWFEYYYIEETYYRWDERKGNWGVIDTWSQSTEKKKLLNQIKNSEQYTEGELHE